jgi:hypothetical protein
MKIKSKIDIITNSSSECYQIKNTPGMTTEEFKEKWFGELIKQGVYDESGNCLDEFCKDHLQDTLLGDIYSEGDYLYLDYPVMCNIDFNILEVLKKWFGDNNVETIWQKLKV